MPKQVTGCGGGLDYSGKGNWKSIVMSSCRQSSVMSSGGLGIVDFKIKADALKLASIISLSYLCSNADSKPFYFIKYFLGHNLSSLRPEWSFLRDNSSPSAQTLTSSYSKCLSVLASLRKIFFLSRLA